MDPQGTQIFCKVVDGDYGWDLSCKSAMCCLSGLRCVVSGSCTNMSIFMFIFRTEHIPQAQQGDGWDLHQKDTQRDSGLGPC